MPTRCEYRRSRRSATTRSPSSETKKKRAAVARARASATANTSAKVALMLPPPEKPRSISRRTTRGRLRVEVLDAARDNSQERKSGEEGKNGARDVEPERQRNNNK